MNQILFGPAGNSEAFYEAGNRHTYQAPEWLHGLGLNAFEYSFGRGVRIGEETANKIKNEAEKYNITMSVHAPYYINLANDKYENNLRYLVQSSEAANHLGADRVIFHPGSRGEYTREEAFSRVKESLSRIIEDLKREGFSHIKYCAETMGKVNQIGNLEEVVELCTIDDMVYPTIDFGHLNARTNGGIQSKADYADILDTIQANLTQDKYQNMHVHFSHIEYTKMGERTHLTLEDTKYGPFFEPLAQLIAERELTPTIICESKDTQAIDAVQLKKMYEEKL